MLLDNGRSWDGGVGGESGGGGLERSAFLGDLLVEGGDLVVEMGLIKGREMMRDTRLGFRGRHRERYGVYVGGPTTCFSSAEGILGLFSVTSGGGGGADNGAFFSSPSLDLSSFTFSSILLCGTLGMLLSAVSLT